MSSTAASMLGSRAALLGASASGRTPNGQKSSSAPAATAARRVRSTVTRASISPPPAGGGAAPDAAAATEAPRSKVSMVSLGCPKNTVDGEVMLGDLFANGFDIGKDILLSSRPRHRHAF